MQIPKTSKLPDWFTLPASENGSYSALDDPMVKEMFIALSEKLPKYNQEHLTEFNSRDVETLIHGDFHGGNHKFGVGENEGKVIVFDFQITGHGLASIEVINLLFNIDITNYVEVEDIVKGIFTLFSLKSV